MNKQKYFGRMVVVFTLLGGCCFPTLASAGEKAPDSEKRYTDYDDFKLIPMRNADLVTLMAEADLITAVQFDVRKIKREEEGDTTWQARVVSGPGPGNTWKIRNSFFKGKWGKELGKTISIKGDPLLFAPPKLPALDVKQGFGFKPGHEYILFLKADGESYRCLAANPGGFQKYHALGRGMTDHRTLFVGQVNGKLAIEAGPGYRGAPMCGPTSMLNALRSIRVDVSLAAKSAGGAAVELELKVGGAPVAPNELLLAAPVLWAEVEGPKGDLVLLAAQDYLLSTKPSPYVDRKTISSGVVNATVELPTGGLPEGAVLTWARANHRKELLGSLGEGEHTVRFLCAVSNKSTNMIVAISNPIKVQGKKGAVGPEALAKLEGSSKSAPASEPKKLVAGASKAATPTKAKSKKKVAAPQKKKSDLDTSTFKGEIWFDSNRDGSWDIFVMNADGSNIRNVTNTPKQDEYEPKVSVDGKRVVFVRGKLKNAGVWGGRWANSPKSEVWVADRDGKNLKKMATHAIRPDWGPAGKVVAYNAKVGKKELFCVQYLATGKVVHPLKKAQKWMRSIAGGLFAPGSRTVAFGGKLWTQLNPALYSAELDENFQMKRFKVIHKSYHGCTPRWSANGKRLYFAHHDPKYKGAIKLWSIRPDGTDAKRFETPSRKAWPGYDPFCESPDGKFVTYLGWGQSGIQVMRLNDGKKVFLTEKKKGVSYGGLHWNRGVGK